MGKFNKILLWLDDTRDPNTGDWLLSYAPEWDKHRDNVVWVKNSQQFVDYIKKWGIPELIAFDHDLGEDLAIDLHLSGLSKKQARLAKKEVQSGFDCASWLVDYCMNYNKELPEWVVQSSNPVGKDNINGLLNNFKYRGWEFKK